MSQEFSIGISWFYVRGLTPVLNCAHESSESNFFAFLIHTVFASCLLGYLVHLLVACHPGVPRELLYYNPEEGVGSVDVV